MQRAVIVLLLGGACLLPGGMLTAAPMIEAKGLMRGMAVLAIDGREQVLRTGERTAEGIELVSADPSRAVLRLDGRELTVTLSGVAGGSFAEREAADEVQVFRDPSGRYRVPGVINGRPVNFLVDTGATILAMSSRDATRLGIDYRGGERGAVTTASGAALSWSVRLGSVSVGDIRIPNVNAAVIEGDYPREILLGHSFLQHVAIQEDSGVMTLRQKF